MKVKDINFNLTERKVASFLSLRSQLETLAVKLALLQARRIHLVAKGGRARFNPTPLVFALSVLDKMIHVGFYESISNEVIVASVPVWRLADFKKSYNEDIRFIRALSESKRERKKS